MLRSKILKLKLLRYIAVSLFAVLSLSSTLSFIHPQQVRAAVNSSNLNYQARLLDAGGAVVPDGSYNVDFKIYTDPTLGGQAVGTCSSTCVWEETYNYGGYSGAHSSSPGPQIVVKDGYLSAYLGQYTSFPTTIKWEQPLYLTMNIGGLTSGGAITWDGEMAPRIQLTALPYAFIASQLANNNSGHRQTLNFGGSPTVDEAFTLPDVPSGVICLQTSSSCGFTTGLGAGFVQGGNSFGATALLGTTDGNILQFQTNSIVRETLDTSNNAYFGNGATAATPNNFSILGTGSTTAGTVGAQITINGGAGATTTTGSAGGNLILLGGNAGGSGINNGGNVSLQGGSKTSTGTIGNILLQSSGGNVGIGTSGTPAGLLSVGGTTGNLTIDSTGNLTTSGTINANGGNISTTAGTANLFNTTTTNTINFGAAIGAGNTQTLNIGNSSTGTTNTTVGSSSGTSTTNIQGSGTNGIINTSGNTVSTQTTNGITISNSTGSSNILQVNNNVAGTTVLNVSNITNNVLTNPGFETNFVGWTPDIGVSGAPTAFGRITTPATSIYDGIGSLQVTTQAAIGQGAKYAYALAASTSYTMSFDVLGSSGFNTLQAGFSYNGVYANESLPAACALLPSMTNSPVVSTGFTRYSCTFTTGSGGTIPTGSSYIYISQTDGGTARSIYIDDVSLTPNSVSTSNLFNVGGIQLDGNITSPFTVASGSNSVGALQVLNQNGLNIFSVDTANGQAIFGNNTANPGKIVLNNGTNNNAVSIAVGSGSANYNLILPTTAPTTGLCLETSPSSSSQLVFGACANSNAAITAVTGTPWHTTSTTTVSTLSVTPTTVGDLEVLMVSNPNNVGINSVSGGNATGWAKAISNTNAGSASKVEMWFSTVATAGTQNITVTFASAPGTSADLESLEFTSVGVSASTSWGVDANGTLPVSSNGSSLTFPTLTPSTAGELYLGFASDNGVGLGAGGSCTNWVATCLATTSVNNVIDYNPNSISGTPINGSVSLGSSSVPTNPIAALFVAYISSTAINNAISTQQGNFNVQAPDSSSVAGTLQANAIGTADILDIKNGTGTIVDSFGSTGNLTVAGTTYLTGIVNASTTINANNLSAPAVATNQTLAPPQPTTAAITGSGAATYGYKVVALDGYGYPTGTSIEKQTAAASAPLALDGLTKYITLTWTAPTYTGTAPTGYLIYRTTATSATGNSGTLGLIGSVSGSTLTFIDAGTAATSAVPAAPTLANATYYFKITALDGNGGESTPSPEFSQATGAANQAVTLDWTPVSGARGYKVYISTTTGTELYYATTYTNSYQFNTPGSYSGALPTVNSAYNDSLNTTGPSQITLGTSTASTSAQLNVAGSIPTSAIGTISTGSQTANVYVQGNYAYATNFGANTMTIDNISNPSNPIQVGSISTGTNPIGLSVQGNYAYVTNQGSGSLMVFNISNPALPQLVSTTNTGVTPTGLSVQGNYAYVVNYGSGSVTAYNITNPSNPVLVSSLNLGTNPYQIYVQGNYAYISSFSTSNVWVVNITNPNSLAIVNTITTVSSSSGLYVSGAYLYIAGLAGNIDYIFNISNPNSPVLVGTFSNGTSSQPTRIFVQGRYAYVTNSVSSTLHILDISNPSQPLFVGSVSTGTQPLGLFVQGRYAYVGNFGNGSLQIYDVGGAYVQQLQSGGIQTGTLSVDTNATINGDTSIGGGLSVGANTQLYGNLGVAGSTQINAGVAILGGATINSLGSPVITSVAVKGAGGGNTWSYQVEAVSANGTTSQASNTGTTSAGNGSLTSGNYNTITWSSVPGAVSYKVFRTVTGGTPNMTGYLVNTTSNTYNDIGSYSSGNLVYNPSTNLYYIYTNGSASFGNAITNTSYFTPITTVPPSYATPGIWGGGVTYTKGNLVVNSGTYYVYINAANTSGNALANTTYWLPVSTTANCSYVSPCQYTAGGDNTALSISPTNGSEFQVNNTVGNSVLSVSSNNNTNLITNPGFETNTIGWSPDSAATLGVNNYSSTIYEGQGSLKVSNTVTSDGPITNSFTSPLLALTTYTLSFYAMDGPTSFTTLKAGWSNTGVGESVCNLNSNTMISNSFQRYTCTFTTGASVTPGSAYIYITQTDATVRTWYLDGVQLELGSTATPYNDGNIQINGIVSGPLQLLSGSNSANEFQISNSAGSKLLNVNSINNSISLNNLTPPIAATNKTLQMVAPTAVFSGSGSGTFYNYEVVAVDAYGYPTGPSFVGISGTAAQSLTSTNKVTLTYSAPTFTGSAPTSYLIYRTTSTGTTSTGNSATYGYIGTSTSATTFVDSGQLAASATPGATAVTIGTYYFKITAIDSSGGETTASPEFSQALTTNQSVLIDWAPISGARGYKIYVSSSIGTESYYATVLTNSYLFNSSTAPGSSPPPPSQNTAYANSLSSSGNSQITLGNSTASTGAQLNISGSFQSGAIGTIATGTNPNSTFVQGSYAYTVNSSSNTLVIDNISVPSNPVQVSSIATGTSPKSVYVQGTYAYVVNSGSNTLAIYNVSLPGNPILSSTISTTNLSAIGVNPTAVWVQGSYAYVVSNLTFAAYNISNPTNPLLAASYINFINFSSLYIQGNYAYVGSSNGSTITILNITNPTSSFTSLTNGFNLPAGNSDAIYVQNSYMYVASHSNNMIYVYSLANVYALGSVNAFPILVNSFSTGASTSPASLYGQGHYLYVGNQGSGGSIQALDISNPTQPLSATNGSVVTGGQPQSIFVQGRYAYVANYTSGTLQIFDIGGAYIQQLQAGGIQTSTLSVDNNASINGDTSISGGLTVSGPTIIGNSLAVTGTTTLTGAVTLAGGIAGGFYTSSLPTPTAPTVSCLGTCGGSSTWSYKVVAVSASGGTTAASPAGSITSGDNSSLNATNYNIITWTAVPGAVSYKLYRTATGASPTSTGYLPQYTNAGSTSFNDTGNFSNFGADGSTPPTTDSSGYSSTNGPLGLLGGLQGGFSQASVQAPYLTDVFCIFSCPGGSTPNTYKIVAVTAAGGTTLSSNAVTINNAANFTGYFNCIQWWGVNGAASYNIYRTSSGGTPSTTGLIINQTAANGYNSYCDPAAAGDGSTPPITDTSTKTSFGNATSSNAQIVLYDGANANTNTVTLTTGNTTSSYTLALPTTAPSANLCLESGSTTTSQLQFTSCANNSPTISFVATLGFANASTGTVISGGSLATVSPTNIGDLEVVTTSIPTAGVSVRTTTPGVSGGGVTTWTKAIANPITGSANRVEIWYGTVTSLGTTPITVTYTGTLTALTEVNVQEFTALGVSASTTWGLGTTGVGASSSNTNLLNMANMNPYSSGQLYYGFAADQAVGLGTVSPTCNNVPSSGTTWNCNASTGGGSNVIDYNLNTIAGTTGGYNGALNLGSSSVNYNSVSALFVAYINSTAINNTTTTQTANFNIQSASSTTVAGTLQANVSGTADILDIKNGAGTIVDAFGSLGSLTVAGGITGGFSENSLPTPAAPTIFCAGTCSGAVTWSYKIIAVAPGGGMTPASPTGSITTSDNSNLSAGLNSLSWPAVTGATSYKIYRTVSGGTPASTGLIATISPVGTGSQAFTDNGTYVGDGSTASNVDSSTQIAVGNTSSSAGQLLFNDGANSNTVTLTTGTTTGSYSIALPTSGASGANLCLESGGGGVNSQLQFTSCANNSPTITPYNGNVYSQITTAGGGTSIAVTPVQNKLGDLEVVTVSVPTSATSIKSGSLGFANNSGGVSTWNRVGFTAANGSANRVEMWFGTITSTGSNVVTANFTNPLSAGTAEIDVQEFTAVGANAGTTWGVDAAGSATNTASSSLTHASLAPAASGELYYAFASQSTPATTATCATGLPLTGTAYVCSASGSAGSGQGLTEYNLNSLAGSGNYQGVETLSGSESNSSISALFISFVASTAINNSTTTQQANFAIQSDSSTAVTGVLQAGATGTADILDLQNSSGVVVDSFGTSGVLTLGASSLTSTPTAGALTLNSSNSAFGVTLSANSTAAAYTLQLPTSAPGSALLCLESAGSGVTSQLQFNSCANNSPSVTNQGTISSFITNGTSSGTIADSAFSAGDLIVVTTSIPLSTTSVSSITATNVTGNFKLAKVSAASGSSQRVEMWYGVANASGAGTVTLNYSASVGGTSAAIDTTDFYAIGDTTNTTWGLDTAAANNSSTAVGSMTYAQLTPTSNGVVYIGYANDNNTGLGTGGSCTGISQFNGAVFTCNVTSGGSTSQANVLTYNANSLSANGYYKGAVNFGSSTSSYTNASALFTAYISSTAINNSSSTQPGNFNVQSANAGTVTGVLQANAAGTADILDILNGAGSIVDTISNTGTIGLYQGISGGVAINSLSQPTAPTITSVGTVGSTTYAYTIVAVGAGGGTTAPSSPNAAFTTGLAFGSLNGTNYNQISWAAVQNAASYQIFRTVGGTTQGYIGTATTPLFSDTGLSASGYISSIACTGTCATSVTYTYEVVAIGTNNGTILSASPTSSIATANAFASMSGSAYNTINWTAVAGASSYQIYRTVGGTSTGLIGSTISNTFRDTGLSGTGANPGNSSATTELNGGLVLGCTATCPVSGATGVAGSLTFQNGTNSSAVNISMASSGSAYNLVLPTAAPGTNLCLETSASFATQLVFNACANSNPSITFVAGSGTDEHSDASALSQNAPAYVAQSNSSVGDLAVLMVTIPNSSVTVTSITANTGGVASWTKAQSNSFNTGGGTNGSNDVEMWFGKITTTTPGAPNAQVNYSGLPGASTEIAIAEYTAVGVSPGTTWGVDVSGSNNGSASTTFNYNSTPLVSATTGELYLGYASVSPTTTIPTGTSYTSYATSNKNLVEYNVSTSISSGYTGTGSTNPTSVSYNAVAANFEAFINSTAINNSVSVQAANFNVQAANSGTVAGTLQANASGNADILDLLNGTGTKEFTVSNTGLTTIGDSATISSVQEWDSHAASTGTSSLAISPHTIGNLVTIGIECASTSQTVTQVLGGGVNNWYFVKGNTSGSSRTELWQGTVTTTGASTINVTYSGSPAATCEIAAQEFSAVSGASTVWSVTSSTAATQAASTNITMPSLTATQYGELYWGYAALQSAPTAPVNPAPFTYTSTTNVTPSANEIIYDTSLSTGTAYAPSFTQASSNTINEVALIITASTGSNLTDNGGAIFTGSSSATDFQVQNASGSVVLNADTLNNRVAVDATFTALTTPVGLNVTSSGAGSTLVASQYCYKITALDGAYNQTLPSSEFCKTPTVGQNNVLTWTAVSGAAGYRVYRTVAAGATGSETFYAAATNATFTDAGQFTPTSVYPPSSNSAYSSGSFTNNNLQLVVGGNGTPTGQVYISGTVPASYIGTYPTTSGLPFGIATQGNYAYVSFATTNQLSVFDVSNPANPTLLGSAPTLANPNYLQVSGKYVYIADQNNPGSLQIYDVSNPYNPVLISTLTTGNNTSSVYVVGNYAYLTNSGGSTFQIINIANPYAPYQTASIAETAGGFNNYVQGKYAYVIGGGTLQSIDVSNPNSPVVLQSYATGAANLQNMYVQGSFAYLDSGGSTTGNLFIVNITNPYNMTNTVTGGYNLNGSSACGPTSGNNADGIFVEGRYAYSVSYSSGFMQVIDVSNPYNPSCIGAVSTGSGTSPENVWASGRYVYVDNGTGNTMSIFDVGGTYTSTLQAGGLETGTLSVDTNGLVNGYLGVAGGLQVGGSTNITGILNATGTSNLLGNVLIGATVSVPVPPSPTVTATCASTCTSQYSYSTAAIDSAGGVTVANSPGGASVTGVPQQFVLNNATLNNSSANYNSITINPDSQSSNSITTYNLYKCTTNAAHSCGTNTNNKLIAAVATSSLSANAATTNTTFGANILTYNGLTAVTEVQYQTVTVTGCTSGGDNSTFVVTAVTGTTISVYDAGGAAGANSCSVTGNLSARDYGAAGAGSSPYLGTAENSATAFVVNNASSSAIITVNTASGLVQIGSGATGDTTGYLIVLDNKTNAGDPTEANGAMYYNSNSGNFRCGVSGAWENCIGGLISSNTVASSGVASCTTACTSFTTNASLPANYCVPGRVININASGILNTSGTPTLGPWGVYLGSNSSTQTSDTLIGGATPTSTALGTLTNTAWNMTYTIICDSTGATGTVTGQGTLTFVSSATSSTSETVLPMSNGTTSTINTTIAQTIYLFPGWGTSAAGNNTTVQQFVVTGM